MTNNEDGRVTCSWQDALAANYGDYAYAPDGGMLSHEEDDTYTVQSGNLAERRGLSKEEIPAALRKLNIPETGWTFE